MAEKEYIERGALIAEMDCNAPENWTNSDTEIQEEWDYHRYRDMILAQPTADVVEVVRCKDCKHSYFVSSCSKYECRKGCGTLKYSTDFCSYGERKE